MRGGPTIVKLGGSFAFSTHLRDWIADIAGCAGSVVLVPGGGPFADAVRAAQMRMGFDACAAHRMGLLAMEQYGCAIKSLHDKLSLAETHDAIRCGLADNLAAHDIVDKAFANFLAASGIPAFILGPDDHGAFARLLMGEPVGIRIIA